jgi:hypothetical protein
MAGPTRARAGIVTPSASAIQDTARARRPTRAGALAAAAVGGVIGAAFFLWIAGVRIVNPREIGWLMRSDWEGQFLGWHIFRHESWQWPPGRIVNEMAPVGTSIALTDSIPLAALALKPWARLLPDPFQYFGLWLCLCFALQGAAGAALTACWTRRLPLRIAGAVLFVLSPVLLDRVGHVGLASHWLLLTAFWLYFRRWTGGVAARLAAWTALVAVGGCVQPYVWAMLIPLSASAAVHAVQTGAYRRRDVAVHFGLAVIASLTVAWTAGWLVLTSSDNLSMGGLGVFSMNLLGLLASNGWAALGPTIPVFEGQTFEGFNYPGAGVLLVAATAVLLLAGRRPTRRTITMIAPLVCACGVLAILSLSPTITMGRSVVAEIPLPDTLRGWYSAFRATGRFFWPAGYLLTTSAIAVVCARCRPAVAMTLLCAAIATQAFDLRSRYIADRAVRSRDDWYRWSDPTSDPYWSVTAPRYRHIVVVPSAPCGGEPAPIGPLLYLAGRHGLSINVGWAARLDTTALIAACRDAMNLVRSGALSDDSIYVVADQEQLRAVTPIPLLCRPLAGATGCIINRVRAIRIQPEEPAP